jgi:2-dehydropantoate 2-reductase
MNVLVMGAGGVGGYFGALLARLGHRVTVIARGPHLDAMQRSGLRVETVIEPAFTVAVHALSGAEPNVVADLVLFTVKSYDTDEGIARIRTAVGPRTTILTLQNGVDSGESLAAAFGWERVLEGVVYIESHVGAPGVIAQIGGPRRVIFGRRAGNGEREIELLHSFTEAGWNAELSEAILRDLWTKLCFIGPFAAANTITGLSAERMCLVERCERLVQMVMAEFAAVSAAEGAGLPADAVETAMDRFRGFKGMSSMLRDRAGGKRLESEALVGSTVRRGTARGIPTPVTESLYSLLTPMRDGGADRLG